MFPYEISLLDKNIEEEHKQLFKGRKDDGIVEVGPKKWIFPKKYAFHAEKYYTFDLKKDDLWVVTCPRSGTTWTQEILWLINNNLDYETASKIPLNTRFPFFEFNMLHSEGMLDELRQLNANNPAVIEALNERNTPGYVIANEMKSPRHIKSHLPLSLLPPKLVDTCKVVYVARNPYDIAVSFYHHNKLFRLHDFQGDFNKYWDLFEKGLILYSPYWEHVKEGWALRDHPNVLFLFYEDLNRDLPANITKICKFLNKQMNEDQIQKLCEYVQIDNFRKNFGGTKVEKIIGLRNSGAQQSIRRGKVGGNPEFEDKELKSKADKWFKNNLEKTDIKFPQF